MKLYIVRHGSDDENYRGGWSNLGLSQKGKEESKLLAEYLANSNISIDKIICSDLKRTVETADELIKHLDIPIQYSKEWREINNGVLAGMLNSEALKKYPGLFFRSLKMDEHYPSGESPNEFFLRIKKSFDNLYNQLNSKDKNIMLITHSGVIIILYYLINNLPWTNKSKPVCQISHTGIHIVEYTDNNWKIIESNNIEHLK